MDQALRMRRRETAAGRHEDGDDIAPASRLGPQPQRQRLPVDELHGDEDLLSRGARVVNVDDVRMVQASERLRLAEEPALRPGSVGPDELEGDVAAELSVVGRVDD